MRRASFGREPWLQWSRVSPDRKNHRVFCPVPRGAPTGQRSPGRKANASADGRADAGRSSIMNVRDKPSSSKPAPAGNDGFPPALLLRCSVCLAERQRRLPHTLSCLLHVCVKRGWTSAGLLPFEVPGDSFWNRSLPLTGGQHDLLATPLGYSGHRLAYKLRSPRSPFDIGLGSSL
jgi:hypothetical protein